MFLTTRSGVRISYEVSGEGPPVVLAMGAGAGGKSWMNQVPALVAAGRRVITFDGRGVAPSDVPPGPYSMAELAGDLRSLLEVTDAAPCDLVGASLGASVVVEVMLSHPHLVRSAVLMATTARSDAVRRAFHSGTIENIRGAQLPTRSYAAAVQAMTSLSPSTLRDPVEAEMWLDTFEVFSVQGEGLAAQLEASGSRSWDEAALAANCVPTLVVSFSDDLLAPPHLVSELADAIAGSEYVEIPDCGHLGYLERPEEVNRLLRQFLTVTTDA